jgi:hypothetical protein
MNVHFFPPACRSTACWPAALTSERPPGRIAVEPTAPHTVSSSIVSSLHALSLLLVLKVPHPRLWAVRGVRRPFLPL